MKILLGIIFAVSVLAQGPSSIPNISGTGPAGATGPSNGIVLASCVGNGSTDDTTCFQAVLDGLYPNGGLVTCNASGKTYLTGSLYIKSDNTTVDLSGCTSKLKASTTPLWNTYDTRNSTAANNFTLRGGTVDGNASAQSTGSPFLLSFLSDGTHRTNRCLITGVHFTNSISDAIVSVAGAALGPNYCRFTGNTFDAIGLDPFHWGTGDDTSIDHNYFSAWGTANLNSDAISCTPAGAGGTEAPLHRLSVNYNTAVSPNTTAFFTECFIPASTSEILGFEFIGNNLQGGSLGLSAFVTNGVVSNNHWIGGGGSTPFCLEYGAINGTITGNRCEDGAFEIVNHNNLAAANLTVTGNTINIKRAGGTGMVLTTVGNTATTMKDIRIIGNSIDTSEVASGFVVAFLAQSDTGTTLSDVSFSHNHVICTGSNAGSTVAYYDSAAGTNANIGWLDNTIDGSCGFSMFVDGSGAHTNQVIRNTQGYNPVGPSTLTCGGSPCTLPATASTSPSTLYLVAGTVSNVTRGGTAVCKATPCAVQLQPNQQAVVTYSVVPTTITLDVQ